MAAVDDLRLAWYEDRDGHAGRRDTLLTLAVAACDPAETPWAARCRDRLVSARPDHFLAPFATIDDALADPGVMAALVRLRAKYPPARVRMLLLRAAAARGPFTGRVEPLSIVLDDLLGTTGRPRLGLAAAGPRRPLGAARPTDHDSARLLF
ncbi:MAG TPA: hypothetical protein VG406_21470, partial [Isosphaeraceae bacterium]|nr:hypothetical protein [Isosphaeraceae bacterium]